MIDTVTLDVWNTLLVHEFYDDRVKVARIRCIVEAFHKAGYDISEDKVAFAYENSGKALSSIWKDEDDVNLDWHLELFAEGLGRRDDDRLIEAIRRPYAQALLKFTPVPVEGAREMLVQLKREGYRMGVISNTGRTPGTTMRKLFKKLGFCEYFDSMIFSNEAECIKPNALIFQKALKDLGSAPSKTVHVGDNMLLDVYGAKSCGMKAILFTKYSEKFEQYMARYYEAGGRHETPDAEVRSLLEVPPIIKRL